ncbi:MAG TPA: anti-sigma factor [Bryobacteraceae bacterium]|nr:anti-sigma factor [Bryobacteraceae bacterium]
MKCADLEIRICDYLDGTLAPAERAAVEQHLAECPTCAAMAKDCAAAVDFMGRAADVEPPPELITRILFDGPWTHKKPAGGAKGWFASLVSPILRPKFSMGMAMTILWLSMLAKFVLPVRQLRPSDFEPSQVWASLEDRGYRVWARTLKFYDNLKFVYQIQTTLNEWQQQQEEEQRTPPPPGNPGTQTDDRKLPVQPGTSH